MLAALRRGRWWHFEKGWLTGPIFDKELRVSSRRRRNFALRFFYILLLTAFIGIVWVAVVPISGSVAHARGNMAVAGNRIVSTIVLFQFIAAQLLAIIMLSTAISDEVYHRTLGLLMTTPINGLQIVMGKLLSKLLQLVLLLGISLPVLAIVRVLGGVSWDYLSSSLLITLTAAIFAGSVTLRLSISRERAYVVILRAALVLAGFYFFTPAILGTLAFFLVPRLGVPLISGPGAARAVASAGTYSSPFYAIWTTTREMLNPTGALRFVWPIHCLVMLGLSALVLAWSMKVVREMALRQATGQLVTSPSARGRRRKVWKASGTNVDDGAADAVKRVQGPPVIWRELRAPFIRGVDNRNSRIGLAATILALLLTYVPPQIGGYLDESLAHVSYALLFVFLGAVFNVVFSATRITMEKESQTWPLLLLTPLSDWDILLGKAISAFRRCLPIWGLLAGHMIFFTLVGYIHPVALFHLLILVAWLTCFITGAGLYFSARLRHTTAAVVANFGLVLGLWAVGPIVVGLLSIAGKSEIPLEKYMLAHPLLQTELVMAGGAGSQNAHLRVSSLEYGSERTIFNERGGLLGFGKMTAIVLVTAAIYIPAGLLFFWRAKCRLRRNIV
jgi:ABC-type transport system involved in multi-copper enzyme maturation permease subunit